MYIPRYAEGVLRNHLKKHNEILVIYGARQVGKSTMLQHILMDIDLKMLQISGEELQYQSIFSSLDLDQMERVIEGYNLLFIDEAQHIENIGGNIKLLFDAHPDLKIILSGSSSFELANSIKEPLTGRTRTYFLYPLSFVELRHLYNDFELDGHLREYLIFGGYPKLYSYSERKEKVLTLSELSSSYLYRDVLIFANLRNSKKLYDLLQLLAYQIGQTVSIHELSLKLKLSSETVERYLDLLEKSFVIYRLRGFSRNPRKEISKMDKIYFLDNGIRNAVINNFASIQDRNDIGQLWENFLVMERLKFLRYNQFVRQQHFWRTYTKVELDYIELYDGQIDGYEFKWSSKKKFKAPKTWLNYYPDATFQLIDRSNYMNFIM